MPPTSGESTTGASASGTPGPGSNLAWHLIPAFRPGETDVNEYTRRLEFLGQVWPQDQLQHLAPRACLLCEGTAFQKVVRLSPEKLKTSSNGSEGGRGQRVLCCATRSAIRRPH